ELAGRLALAGATYLEVLLQTAEGADAAQRAEQFTLLEGRIERLGEIAEDTAAGAEAQLLDLAACVVAQADHLAGGGSEDSGIYLEELSALAAAPGSQTQSGCRL